MALLPFDPATVNPRELARHYIPASKSDTAEMLKTVGATKLSDLYSHIPDEVKFSEKVPLPQKFSQKK